jgi:hypothetical protein
LTPDIQDFDLPGTHRLIPSRFSEEGTVLAEIADSEVLMRDAILLDGATNDRIQGEQRGLPGISTFELVYGIANAQIVNAAFTHTNDEGCRFNDWIRGAWYAAAELDTCIAEVSYHKARRLADVVVPGLPGARPDQDVSTYDDWMADFRADFHVLEPVEAFAPYLQPEPVPQCYRASQELARGLMQRGSSGIVYRSVRRSGARCVACFRPALVYRPRRAVRIELTLSSMGDAYASSTRTVTEL